MAARPNDLPSWATSPSAMISTPPAATRANGWIPGIKPPAEWFNWWMNLVFNWVNYLQSGGVFDDLAEAVEELEVGDVTTIYENDRDVGPGTEAQEVLTLNTAAGGTERGIDTCGDLLVYAINDMDPIGFGRDLVGLESGGSPDVTYVRTTGGTVVNRVATDGEVVVALYGVAGTGRYIEAWNATTGASLWVRDFVVTTVDFCLKAGRVFVLHNRTAGTVAPLVDGRDVHALNATTGAVLWTYQHTGAGGARYAIASNGRQVFLQAAASSFASAATLRAIRASDGADVDNEAGTGTVDDSFLSWNSSTAPTPSFRGFDCDDDSLFITRGAAAVAQIERRAAADGATVWSIAHDDPTLGGQGVAVDQGYVFVCMSDNAGPAEGFVEARDKATGALAWRFAVSDKTAPKTACVHVTTDGQALFAIAEDEPNVWRITRGNLPTRYVRVDPPDFIGGIRNMKVQPGGQ